MPRAVEIAKQKKLATHEDLNPNRRFVDNPIIALISNSDSVNDILATRKLSWANQYDAVKDVYNRMLEAEFYKNYMALATATFADDRRFAEDFSLGLSRTRRWLMLSTRCRCSGATTTALPYIWLCARCRTPSRATTSFAYCPSLRATTTSRLRVRCLSSRWCSMRIIEIVDRYTNNWDVERVVFMDNLILSIAIAELTNFDSIPVKVTLDEWIDIAKYYSSPSSSTFVNGVLDKVVADLTAEGKISKSGRGLL